MKQFVFIYVILVVICPFGLGQSKTGNPDEYYFLITGNDCINCYASVNMVFGKLEDVGIHPQIVLKDVSKRNADDFLTYKLNLNTNSADVILSDSLFDRYALKGSSTLLKLNGPEIVFRQTFKSLSLAELEANIGRGAPEIVLSDTLDVSKYVTSKADRFYTYNDNTIIIFNATRGKLYSVNIETGTAKTVLERAGLEPLIDTFIMRSEVTELGRQANIKYADYNKSPFQMFPSRVNIKGLYTSKKFNYVPLDILSYDPFIKDDGSGDTVNVLKWFSFFAIYNKNWELSEMTSFPYQLEKGSTLFNSLSTGRLLGDSLFYMNVSSDYNDSLVVKYRLLGNEKPHLIQKFDIEPPVYFPKIGPGGYSMRYICMPLGKQYYTYLREPVVYQFSDNQAITLDGFKWQTYEKDSLSTKFWMHDVFFMEDGNSLVVASELGEPGKTKCNIYSGDFKQLKHSINILDVPVFQARFYGDKIIMLENEEDYARLRIYNVTY